MKLTIKKYNKLDPTVQNTLADMTQHEFGDVPIVQEFKWAIPDWVVYMTLGEEIASVAHVIERSAYFDRAEVIVGGLNNLITKKIFRGKGMGVKVLKRTHELIFNELQCDAGLLLCADSLIPYYQKFGWYKVSSGLYFDQPDGKKQWQANVMLKTEHDVLHPDAIDLNGLPW